RIHIFLSNLVLLQGRSSSPLAHLFTSSFSHTPAPDRSPQRNIHDAFIFPRPGLAGNRQRQSVCTSKRQFHHLISAILVFTAVFYLFLLLFLCIFLFLSY
ncbi:uncharacterized protein PgNI_03651, partial [Pyricularia grisea]|uniref:Uncharacterized protein n=1 Tax=Pyricularia grisea TaxID=148305 RepID=A0A6P8BC21_PYRGI